MFTACSSSAPLRCSDKCLRPSRTASLVQRSIFPVGHTARHMISYREISRRLAPLCLISPFPVPSLPIVRFLPLASLTPLYHTTTVRIVMIPQDAKYLNEKSLRALQNLKDNPPSVDNFQTSKRSAVLVALVANSDGDLEVILTVRSSTLRTNAGDSAFPGGKMDPEDVDLIATAKREALEEVQLFPSESQTLTILSPILSRHMQVVTPVVVYCPAMTAADISSLYPNPGEVAAIFTSPLEYFLSPRPGQYVTFEMQWVLSNYRVHRFEGCGASNHILGEPEVDPEDHRSSSSSSSQVDPSKVGWPVYGMTAGVLIHVAKIAFQREPDFELTAPGQIDDAVLTAEWYNRSFGPRSSL